MDRTGQLRGRIEELQEFRSFRIRTPEVCLLQFQVDAYVPDSPKYHRRLAYVRILAGTPTRLPCRRSLKKPGGEPSQVFDLDLGAIDEIIGSVLDKNDPAESGNREKC